MEVINMVFQCKQCGLCCKTYAICVSYSDITRWHNTGRTDILEEISWVDNYPEKSKGDFYIVKTILNPKRPCPFLVKEGTKFSCKIQGTKPRICKDFPEVQYGSVCPEFKFNLNTFTKLSKEEVEDFRSTYLNRNLLLGLLIENRRRYHAKYHNSSS